MPRAVIVAAGDLDSLPGEVQDHWCGIARSMYAIVAIAGGATVGVVKDPQG